MVVTFGSLFSGIGGLDLAVEACGWSPAWQVEQDPFCTKILERHWPDVRRYGDIREVDWRSVERVEFVCGGFPCQPFSVAGQNRGEDDERNMWPETYRAVRELGPRYVFLENVPGLLAHGYFGRILGDLAEGGYDAVWDTFTAAEVGAPHRRERLFILAYTTIDIRRTLGDDGREPSDGPSDRDVAYAGREPEHVQQSPQRLREPAGEGVRVADADAGRHREQAEEIRPGGPAHLDGSVPMADAAGSRQRTGLRDDDAGQPNAAGGGALAVTEGARLPELFGDGGEQGQPGLERGHFPPGPDDRDAWARVLAEVPALEPAVCRVATGVPDRTHRLRALGNAVVPTQGATALRSLWQRMMAL